MIHGSKCVLVVAAHPDDEILGCGGTLARLAEAQVKIYILILGEGPVARGEAPAHTLQKEARKAALDAAKIIGAQDVFFENFPDNRFDTVPLLEIIQSIEVCAQKIVPDLVFTHHHGDINLDHGITHRAALTAFRPLPSTIRPCVLGFEVLSSTEYAQATPQSAFEPNVYVDITDFLHVKEKALQPYATEMRPWPHPRSVRGVQTLAHLRGCHCGHDAAEAFVLYRCVV